MPSASRQTSGSSRSSWSVRAALAASALLVLTACAGTDADAGTVSEDGRTLVRYQGSSGSVTFPELAADLGYLEDVELDWVGDTTSGPQDIQSAATGETDVGSAFNGAVVKLATASAGITAVVSSYGSDDLSFTGYFTLEGSPITSPRDLIGKTVGMNTLGAHHESVVRSWLAQGGLTQEEIEQVELVVVPPINTEQALREGQIDVGALGGVLREGAVERGGVTPLFTDTELYGAFSYGTYVFRDSYIEENPEAVEDFVQGTARAIRWTQVTPADEVRARYTSIIENRGRNETTDLVQFWRSPGIGQPGGVIADDEISVWIDWLEENDLIEDGTFDDATEVYTNEYNPYSNGTFPADAGPDGEPLG